MLYGDPRLQKLENDWRSALFRGDQNAAQKIWENPEFQMLLNDRAAKRTIAGTAVAAPFAYNMLRRDD